MAEAPVAGVAAIGPVWLSASDQAVWRAYLDATRLVNERMQRQLIEDSGLSLAEYEILVQLSELPDHRLRMSELATRAVNSRSRLTHTVNRMEDRGLVRREACPDDGRGVLCILTPHGFAVLESAAPGHVAEVRRALFDLLDAADVATLGVVMEKVRTGLRNG